MITIPIPSRTLPVTVRVQAASVIKDIRDFLCDNVATESERLFKVNHILSIIPTKTPVDRQWDIFRNNDKNRVEITVVPESFEAYIALKFLNND